MPLACSLGTASVSERIDLLYSSVRGALDSDLELDTAEALP